MNARSPARVEIEPASAWRIVPSGDCCLIVEFDALDPVAANRSVRAAALRLRSAVLPGVTEIVPALTTLGVHYRPYAVSSSNCQASPCTALADALAAVLSNLECEHERRANVLEIPVCYGGNYGPDLEEVAAACGLTPAAVIELHCAEPVDVMMLGFAPGHPYIGRFDARLAPPRRSTPRMSVPAGSIGLANRQSVIYPMSLPGGWNLIGRTPFDMFEPHREQPCLLKAGDRVRFVPVDIAQFDVLLFAAQAVEGAP